MLRGKVAELLLVLLVGELVLLSVHLVLLLLAARIDLAPRRRDDPALTVRRAREARLEMVPLVHALVRSRASSSHTSCYRRV